jgi:hypothetical protein
VAAAWPSSSRRRTAGAAATARRGYAFTGMYTANKKADVRIHDDLY